MSKSCGAVDWGRRKRPVSRWLTAGSQPAPPRHRQPARQGCCCAFCPRGVLGIFAIAMRRLASGRLFSTPARPTSPDNPSCPCPVRAEWTFFVALGRFGACADLLFSRGVRASSVQISHPHPCLSRERVLGRLLAVYACAFWCVRDAQKARRAGQKKTNCRRAWQPGCRQKPPGCQSQAGAATTSSSSLLPMLQ